MPPKRTFVLGVPVDAVTEEDILAFVADAVQHRRMTQIVTINAEYVMRARRDPVFRAVLCSADLCTPDGAGVVWAARRRGTWIRERVGGADLIWSLAAQAVTCGHRLFLLGGAAGVAEIVACKLQERFPGLIIAGTYAGYPDPTHDRQQVALIKRAKPDILLVAFGAPAQDLWIARNKLELGVPVSMGVGGSFDYVAGRAVRAPLWMRKAGLDWLWRLVHQPWRWRRMMVLPPFAWLALTRSD
jgi:N-acetylglucosaminyldiphosphoundecaprenol N-acetyl-beta-D-mannosaminyltransferase